MTRAHWCEQLAELLLASKPAGKHTHKHAIVNQPSHDSYNYWLDNKQQHN